MNNSKFYYIKKNIPVNKINKLSKHFALVPSLSPNG